MEWYKVYIYDKQGLCLATERHETEDDATESVIMWNEDDGIQAYYCPQD
tara:strand:- start:21 stop:167 length:147 start_codon:yes stop_codon:yes gene_type:complete